MPHEIWDGVWLGGIGEIRGAKGKQFARDFNVRYVLTAAEGFEAPVAGAHWMSLPVQDTPQQELSPFFGAGAAFIESALNERQRARRRGDKNPPSVYVHCAAGISRSVTMLAAWLMLRHGWSAADAVRWIQQRRSIASPNPGFLRQLRKWQDDVVFFRG